MTAKKGIPKVSAITRQVYPIVVAAFRDGEIFVLGIPLLAPAGLEFETNFDRGWVAEEVDVFISQPKVGTNIAEATLILDPSPVETDEVR